jgi:hypothetical protein
VPGRVSFVSCFDLGKGMDLLCRRTKNTYTARTPERASDCCMAPSSAWQAAFNPLGVLLLCVCVCTVHASRVAEAASSFTQHSLTIYTHESQVAAPPLL